MPSQPNKIVPIKILKPVPSDFFESFDNKFTFDPVKSMNFQNRPIYRIMKTKISSIAPEPIRGERIMNEPEFE